MDRRRFLRRGIGLGVALLTSSARADPRALQVGTDTCPYCNMLVIDGRFAAQVVTEGGRILTYDAIECLLDHEAGYGPPPPTVAERWLSNRAASEREGVVWLAAEHEAVLLYHPRLRTPMGGGLAAFAMPQEAHAFANDNRLADAQLLSWSEAATLATERPWVPAW